ncbi:MAG: hypothetical protein GY862_30225 [Gammaproteobacteria bacterium]|nr:hypothetical protein [Gammaproteobacteria bacterium]
MTKAQIKRPLAALFKKSATRKSKRSKKVWNKMVLKKKKTRNEFAAGFARTKSLPLNTGSKSTGITSTRLPIPAASAIKSAVFRWPAAAFLSGHPPRNLLGSADSAGVFLCVRTAIPIWAGIIGGAKEKVFMD